MERILEERRKALMNRFSAEYFFMFLDATGVAAEKFFLVDEQALEKGHEYLLDRPMHPDERMLLFDISTLRCYSACVVCEPSKERAVAKKLASGASVDPANVILLTDYPYEAVYLARKEGASVLALNGKPQPDKVNPDNCIYIRMDVSGLQGESAEHYVENRLRAAVAHL